MLRALIVDDEFWMLEGLKKVIKRDCPQFVVTAAARDGLQALELLEREAFDLVITDIRMPRMDGLQLLQEMRSRGKTMPVLIFSAHSDFDYAKQAIHYGAFDYILKPINRTKISSALKRIEELLHAQGKRREALIDTVPEQPLQGKQAVEEMKKLIHNEYMNDLSMVDIAEKLGFNSTYLSRLFKQESNMGFVQYLTEYRLCIAVQLMKKRRFSMTEIARQVGYTDYKHFRKVFKQYKGMSPSDFVKI
ncbi:response regulator [Paenibacillus sp. J5C_2022]|uniref:response regulator transcription factor n=1 Tax=Paenibacillus sp. J5C2022 TaxID=2977129 RepID=UPI0021CFADEC|nr:response regulator [Paenibacillus sp. J5C2022]MCU6708829.1 response regulator [Paenibacillus sp. J5C2022]